MGRSSCYNNLPPGCLILHKPMCHLLRFLPSCVSSRSDVDAAGIGVSKLNPGTSASTFIISQILAPPGILLITILVFNLDMLSHTSRIFCISAV